MNDNPYVSPGSSEVRRSRTRWKLVFWLAIIAGLICGAAVSYLGALIDAHYLPTPWIEPSTTRLLVRIRSALLVGLYLDVALVIIAAIGRWRAGRDQRATKG
jgi:hypothetical protein